MAPPLDRMRRALPGRENGQPRRSLVRSRRIPHHMYSVHLVPTNWLGGMVPCYFRLLGWRKTGSGAFRGSPWRACVLPIFSFPHGASKHACLTIKQCLKVKKNYCIILRGYLYVCAHGGSACLCHVNSVVHTVPLENGLAAGVPQTGCVDVHCACRCNLMPVHLPKVFRRRPVAYEQTLLLTSAFRFAGVTAGPGGPSPVHRRIFERLHFCG